MRATISSKFPFAQSCFSVSLELTGNALHILGWRMEGRLIDFKDLAAGQVGNSHLIAARCSLTLGLAVRRPSCSTQAATVLALRVSALSMAMPFGPLKLPPLGGVTGRAGRPLVNESTYAASDNNRTLRFILFRSLGHVLDFAGIRDGNPLDADTAFQFVNANRAVTELPRSVSITTGHG
jgi:hypothetical protein